MSSCACGTNYQQRNLGEVTDRLEESGFKSGDDGACRCKICYCRHEVASEVLGFASARGDRVKVCTNALATLGHGSRDLSLRGHCNSPVSEQTYSEKSVTKATRSLTNILETTNPPR